MKLVASSLCFFLPLRSSPCHSTTRLLGSVAGPVYTSENGGPVVTLFTKQGCTLCDTAKETLHSMVAQYPHSLTQVDITEERHWWDRYKYDIPVLHLDGRYWAKHRLSVEEATEGFEAHAQGTFVSPPGEPNAAAMERRRKG